MDVKERMEEERKSQTLEQLADMVLRRINDERGMGCEGCVWMPNEEWEMPCKECKRAKKDYYRGKR